MKWKNNPMRGVLASVTALLLGTSLALAGGMSAAMPDQATIDASMIWQVAASGSSKSKKTVKKPSQTRPIKQPPPAGAREATKGQKGRCICSTNAQGSTTCTGDCR
jgi:hypothetical protein